jgi:CBS domain-containing protein
MPRSISDLVVRDAPVLRTDDQLLAAVTRLLDSGLPALPVVDGREAYAGVFGEREFLAALFPGYVGTLQGAGFLTRSVEAVLEKRAGCAAETVALHLNDEHVQVAEDFADVQLAEVFLHHRVLIVPVVAGRRVVGVVTRADFFRALATRFVGQGG